MLDRTKLRKDRLDASDVEPLRIQVVAPTVTRRPELDSMLADLSIIAKAELEHLRTRSVSGVGLDEDQISRFTTIAELVLKQSRLEMAVEKHVEERTASMDTAEIAQGIGKAMRHAMAQHAVGEEIIERCVAAVMGELGLEEG